MTPYHSNKGQGRELAVEKPEEDMTFVRGQAFGEILQSTTVMHCCIFTIISIFGRGHEKIYSKTL